MARLFTERPVLAMLLYLQTWLNAEIAFIASERNDDVLPIVESWFSFPRPIAMPDHVEVEVYERGMQFPRIDYNLSQWLAGQRAPVDFDVEVLVALNAANREAGTNGEIFNRGRRYAAAILRTVMNAPTIGQGDAVTTRPMAPSVKIITGVPSNSTVTRGIRVEVPFLCRTHEVSTGETVLDGGHAPAAVLEQV